MIDERRTRVRRCLLARARAILALWLAATGCSGASDPTGNPADTITLVVTTNEDGQTAAGSPIVGASVLVDRGARGVERATTDGDGMAQFAADGVVAYHVIYPAGDGWQVYTVTAVGAGTIQLGGRATFPRWNTMTLALPAGQLAYDIHGPTSCEISSFGVPGPMLHMAYRDTCEGKPARLVTYGFQPDDTWSYLDAGTVVLANGTTQTPPGTYVALSTSTLQISKLPPEITSVLVDFVARSDLGLTALSQTATRVSPAAGFATAMILVPPGGDLLRVFAAGAATSGDEATSELLVPANVGSVTAFDATAMPPLFDALQLDHPPSLAWTGGGTSGTLIGVEAAGGVTRWTAFLDPSATRLTFPPLPKDLAAAVPLQLDIVSVAKIAVPGAATADLVPTIDRTWPQWPDEPSLVTAAGGSRTEVHYFRGAAVR